ncbi:MAG: hypothetical protein GAK35_00872 [Herbaspirillum frisingense]|uniref:DUF985 domain-containing protein n=1 Tax=Herbaspirillum frisingense TaxID=92645 RepID=A0A7V8JVC5_9BURK|nr:MAG: hypothetical protein GAK35_00872 [Herbaspirillum frisingense]
MSKHTPVPDDLIARLQLQPHPEGGYFRETYRDAQEVVRRNDSAVRSASTAIYYLLCNGAYSTWHRIRSDELWHFYQGTPLHVYVLRPGGELTVLRLGAMAPGDDTVFQAMVPAGSWFAARCADPAGYSLVGCTVAPGFEFSEFEIADVGELLAGWPQHGELIKQLAPAASAPAE